MPAQPGPAEIVFAGVATWDTVALLPHLPDPDGRVVAEAMGTAGGGPAATAAVTAARLGLRMSLIAAVGDDREATLITESLESEGVDTTGVRRVPGAESAACVILVDRSQGSRAICVRPGPAPVVDAAQITKAHWLHVDHAALPAVLPLLAALPQDSRPTVSYDAGNLHPRRCPPEVDVYVPTLETLRTLYGPGGITDLLDAAHRDGARVVVATDGARGAVASGPEGRYVVPGHAGVMVRSTLGAGDVFQGALVAALVRGVHLGEALAYANAAAALACRGLDGRSGIPGDDEVRAPAAEVPAQPIREGVL